VFGIPSLLWNVTDFGKLWLFNVSLSFKKCQKGKVISFSVDLVTAVAQFRQNATESRIITFDNCSEERTLHLACIGGGGDIEFADSSSTGSCESVPPDETITIPAKNRMESILVR
jgi:hypothetical protein